jgi:hypothetical protein
MTQRTDAPAVAEAAESESGSGSAGSGNADADGNEPSQKDIAASIRQGEVSDNRHVLVLMTDASAN